MQSTGEAITPGDWIKPTTAMGRLPAAVGAGVGNAFNVAGQGYQQLAEVAGFPRVGAVAANVVSHLPDIAGAKSFGETAIKGAKAGAAKLNGTAPEAVAPPDTPMPERAITGGGAASASANPYPELSNATYPKAGDQIPVLKPSMVPESLPAGEQAVRAQILRDVGVADATGGRLLDSWVNGNPQSLWDEVTEKNRNTAEGQVNQDIMAKGQQAVRNYGNSLVERTGANMHIDAESSGQLIVDPLRQAEDLVHKNASGLYTEARNRVGDNPIATDNMQSVLADPDWRFGLMGKNEATLNAIEGRLKAFQEEEFAGPNGPRTVAAAEKFRQFLNDQKTHSNTTQINALQAALDDDIGTAGGADLLGIARANWKTYKENFADPKGMASLLDESGPNGINRQVPYAKVSDRFLNMDNGQASHIWDQLGNVRNIPGVTPEMIEAAEAAKNELKAAAIRKVTEAAGKTASVNGVAAATMHNAMQRKLGIVLSDDPVLAQDLSRFSQATQLIPDNTAYRGAEVQKETAARKGAVAAIPWAAGGAGAALGGAAGSLAGVPGTAAAVGATLAKAAGEAKVTKMQQAFAATRAADAAARYERNAKIGAK